MNVIVMDSVLDTESINLADLDKAGVKLHSCVHIAGSIVQELQSPTTTELTRASISHYEAIFQVNVLAELRVISPEILLAAGTNTPHSTKVHSTLRHQQPEWYDQIMDTVSQIKAAWRTQWESELKETSNGGSTEVSQGSKSTTVTVSLVDEDECTISGKKKARVSTDSV
eukprot:728431-Amphidinium_carterae.1